MLEILEGASNSLPDRSEILFTCPTCGSESAIWMAEGKLRPGQKSPEVPVSQLRVYVDTTYGIDCIYQGRLYHMPKRREAV